MESYTSSPETSGRSGLELVNSRATTDARFRRELLTDPRSAIFRAFGVAVPPGLRLRFTERPQDVDLMIVLPDLIDSQGALEDADLGPVTGGAVWQWWADPA